jgi:hypothetical protein
MTPTSIEMPAEPPRLPPVAGVNGPMDAFAALFDFGFLMKRGRYGQDLGFAVTGIYRYVRRHASNLWRLARGLAPTVLELVR